MRKIATIAAALSLAGCAATPHPAPGVRVEYRDVIKEVQRPCPVSVPERPAPLKRPLPDSPARLIDLLTAKLAEYAGDGKYADQAEAALKKCTKE